jgi:hypothetical protein
MKPVDDRTAANLDVVLEETCRSLPHGGNHSFRKRVALKLLKAARSGNTTLASLTSVARSAMRSRSRARYPLEHRDRPD